jgi:hypothetical protein
MPDEYIPARLFTLQTANALVPRLLQVFAEVRTQIEEAQRLAKALDERGYPPARDKAVEVDPSAPEDVQRRQRELQDLAGKVLGSLRGVAELGAEVKSPDGLVDFRSRHNGEVVYLCWRYPESEIGAWHDLQSGFTGRQKITDPEAFEGDWLQ